MMGKAEGTIITLLFRLRAPLTIHQISTKLHKAYPHVHTITTQLIDEGVLNKSVVGNAYACSLNLENEKAKALVVLQEYAHASHELKKRRIPKTVVEDVKLLRKTEGIQGVVWDGSKLILLSYSSLAISSSSAASSSFSSAISLSSSSIASHSSGVISRLNSKAAFASPPILAKALSSDHVVFFGTMNLLDFITRQGINNREVKP